MIQYSVFLLRGLEGIAMYIQNVSLDVHRNFG